MTPQQFIDEIAPAAVSFYCSHKISAALIIAQGALESGWGATAKAMGNNLFGIKADASWTGPTTIQQTKEFINSMWETITAEFRAYPSIAACLADHDGFLLQPRYRNLVGVDYKAACHLIAAVDHYATDPTYESQLLSIINQYGLAKYDAKEACNEVTLTYPAVKAQLNGKSIAAIDVDNATYLIWTVARDSGANLTKVVPDDVEIDGKKPLQVVQGGNTYIEWSSIPGITPVKLDGGGFNFVTKHTYTMVVTEAATATVGQWAQLEIQTLDNGKPLGKQVIVIAQNGVQVVKDYTDANGQYPYAITETTDKTDTTVVTWEDPAGGLHASTHQTAFTVPVASATPIPTGSSVVATFPILPQSDASNAVYFEMIAPNGQAIQCQLDTGAFELMFTSSAASILALKNEGALTISGVGGQTAAYYSHATFTLGGVPFTAVPCTVDDGFTGYPLFGYKFFVDNGYDLLVSQKHNTVTIMKAN